MNLFATKPITSMIQESEVASDHSLKRSLGAGGLVALGIGAIIGAGIFTLTGVAASTKSGPAIVLAFVAAAIASGFAGLCYSEFAAMIPVAGSAYTYAYATMGELLAWIIGWDLMLEYTLGAATVSIGWSQTLLALLQNLGVRLPPSLVASPFQSAQSLDGKAIHGAINLPAVFIVLLVSAILIAGIQESATVNSIIVVLKVTVVVVFIAIGWEQMKPGNHLPFIPPNTGHFGEFGWSGILAGAGLVFYAFIGFDTVSTAAQEAKQPQRNMPIGILGSLAACTILFILYSYVLTGIVNYKELNVASPLSLALTKMPYPWLSPLMNLAVLLGLTSVLLAVLFGQSRVFFSMANDGLLPAFFGDVHPRLRTPWKANLVLMIFVAVFAGFAPITFVGQMTSIGTLLAFVVVCGGILVLRRTQPHIKRPFETPLVPLVPILGVLCNFALMLGLGWGNWLRLGIWLVVGLTIYFGYSRHHSRLRVPA
jgi:basic amino acid/polyamine antiporter, APA family